VCASRGEAGSICDPSLVPDGDSLGGVRARELRDAAAILGVAEVIVLDHPDGDLRWDHVPELHAEIVLMLERYRPDAVITFAEDGLYWHLDHIGVHERTYTAVLSLGAAAPPLYYVTMPEGIMLRWSKPHTPRAARRPIRASGESPPTRSALRQAADVRDRRPRLGTAQAGGAALPQNADGPRQPDRVDRRGRGQAMARHEQFRRSPLDATGDPDSRASRRAPTC
jgi:LmbE family N-acetylglucosaminyl deacetylase